MHGHIVLILLRGTQMSICESYLRLFDLSKYREIQLVIDSITSHDVDCQRVISLAKAAIEIVELVDCEKHNDYDMKEDCIDEKQITIEELEELLEVLRKEELLSWIYTNSCNIRVLRELVFFICCPGFQQSKVSDRDSDTTVGYTDILNGSEICSLECIDLIAITPSNIDSLEIIPIVDGETEIYIYSQKQLIEINKIVSQDIFTLSQLGDNLGEEHSEKKIFYLGFYSVLKKMIDYATYNPSYTIINERSLV